MSSSPSPSPPSVEGDVAGCKNDRWPFLTFMLAFIPFTVFSIVDWYIEEDPQNDDPAVQAVIYVLLVALMVASPLTHGLASLSRTNFSLYQPFEGGIRFVILQGAAWTTWAVGLSLAFMWLFSLRAGSVPQDGVVGWVGSAGLLSQLMLLLSLRFFSPDEVERADPLTEPAVDTRPLDAEDYHDGVVFDHEAYTAHVQLCLAGACPDMDVMPAPSPAQPHVSWQLRWNTVGVITLLFSCISTALLLYLEHIRPEIVTLFGTSAGDLGEATVEVVAHSAKLPVGLAATLTLIAAAPVTHTIMGRRKHQGRMGGGGSGLYLAFFFAGWLCYAIFLALLVYSFYQLVISDVMEGLVAGVGVTGLLSQILVLFSVLLFSTGAHDDWFLPGLAANFLYTFALFEFVLLCAFSMLFLSLEESMIFWSLFVCVTAAGTRNLAFPLICLLAGVLHSPLALGLTVVFIAYGYSYTGSELSGSREWLWFKQCALFTKCGDYFGLRTVGYDIASLDPKQTYMMGFHTHGIYPVTSIILCSLLSRAGIEVSPMAASIALRVPILRDILLWAGVREVSRKSIRHALSSGRSTLIIPGGQAEMLLHSSDTSYLAVVTRHRGFIREAIRGGAFLVPVLSMFEDMLTNVELPSLQSAVYRRVGFVFPLFPMGRAYTPFPSRTPVILAIGTPIPVVQSAEPDEAYVAELHTQYFRALHALFYTWREEAGYPERELVWAEAGVHFGVKDD